ncbi:MAG TPA: M28 family peptidase [Bryobacteraceae bacterium]|jgi:hypothetical protein
MRHRRILLFALSAAAILAATPDSPLSPANLRTWLTYLSSDDLEGRQTFSEGLGLAAAYIADQLKDAGIQPAGEHGTYLQRVEVLGVKTTSHSTLTVDVNGRARTFKDGEGITFPKNVGGKRTLTINHVEFTGYGVNLDAAHNDYRGLDVKGKAVVWLGARGPKGTDPQAARRQLNARASLATEEMGAFASIAPPPEPLGGRGGRGPNAGAPAPAPAPAAPAPARAGGRGTPAPQPDFTTVQKLGAEIAPRVTATDDFLDFLFSGSSLKYADLKARAQVQDDLPKFELAGVTLTFHLDADYQVVKTQYTRNVAAIIPGSDPRLKDTYVAFGAHYDHVGYNQGILSNNESDRISNGADDDGSGTTALIGLARAFAQGPGTKRSLLFVWHAGEEEGLYGSRYFADHPLVPLDKISAQLNIDMIGRNRDNKDSEANTVYTVGADRISTELHNLLIDANASLPKPLDLNFELNDSTDPERVYYRSDHYSYAAKGIPIIFFTTGLHPDYHKVSDSVEKINFEKMSSIAQLIYETGRSVANLDHMPARDNKGPRFGKGSSGKIN